MTKDWDTIHIIKKIPEIVCIDYSTNDLGWDTIHINEKTLGVMWSDCSITYITNNRIKDKIDYQIV